MSSPTRSPLERGIAILMLLAKWHGPVSLEMVTNELKVNKSSAFRLLEGLERANLVTRTGSGTGYLLGSDALVLGEAFKRHFVISGLCDMSLLNLRDSTGESAGAFVLQFPYRLCFATMESTQPIRRILNVGERRPLHTGAVGKVMLAHLSSTLLQDYLTSLEPGATRREQRLSRATLETEIETARKDGYAVSVEETGPDIWGVAVPIAAESLIGALVITGPMSRFPSSLGATVKLLKREAKSIIARL
ncbi:helix-turn-helix domain-containing protein [Bordetella petrii]|nr:helix-turn-helix domain-containing protein [Bordetella petrii]